MKSTFFIIHGTQGNPAENWFPWLKDELEKLGHEVYIPAFPTPQNQSLENWMKVFEGLKDKVTDSTIFIGHSIGAAFVLSLLEQAGQQMQASFLVAPFVKDLGNAEFDELNKTFIHKNFDWQKIKDHSKEFYIYHGDNDPYVPVERSQEVAEQLDEIVFTIKDAGHFNSAASYNQFPRLLADINMQLELDIF